MLAATIFGFGGETFAQQNSVCSSPPEPGDRVFCSEQSADDINLNILDPDITTTESIEPGINVRNSGTGDIRITVNGGTIMTGGTDQSGGILGSNSTQGSIDIRVKDTIIATQGTSSAGVDGHTESGTDIGKGDVHVRVEGGSITTAGDNSVGVRGSNNLIGTVEVAVRDTTIRTQGIDSTGVQAAHHRDGDITLAVDDTRIVTQGDQSLGITAWHSSGGEGDINLDVRGGSVTTEGQYAYGIFGRHQEGTGDINLEVRDGSVTTEGQYAYGIYGLHEGTGDINLEVRGGSVTTKGQDAYGILGFHLGEGGINIETEGGSITTEKDTVHAIYGLHLGSGSVDIQIKGGRVHASGENAHGIRVGSLDADGVVRGSVGFDAQGYRRQSVTVDGPVRGGSGSAAGVYLAGGGRVVIRPHGRVGAASGVAVRAAGTGAESGPLSVELALVDPALNAHPVQEALGDGRIVNHSGSITAMVNGVVLWDAAGATGRWAPNGPWDVEARAAAEGGLRMAEAYAPRAALYESLPGLLLRLDAGAPVPRPETPVWAQAGYGVGSGDPKHSRVGTTYDFDRIEAAVGTTRDLGAGVSGSAWLRRIQSEAKVDLPGGGGELELHGVGAGGQAHWRATNGLYVSGELSLTDFDVDATSSRHGRLARDVGAELWQARLEAGCLMAQGEGLTLRPRVWAWHAEVDVDDFTDATGARVSYSDESRSAAGLGLRAEVGQSESSLYGSVDLESLFAGEETAVRVSGRELDSESKRTRVLIGVGGQQQSGRVTLRGGLRLADPGGRNQEVSASVELGGSF